MAIDEQREDYQVTLWEAVHPVGTREVEQRWFPGAHANVGGGYQDDLLPDPPSGGSPRRASATASSSPPSSRPTSARRAARTPLPEDFKLRGDEYLSPVRDSYREFLRGIYRFARALRVPRPLLPAHAGGGVGRRSTRPPT